MNKKVLAMALVIASCASGLFLSAGVGVTSTREDAYGNFRFRVEIDGIVKAGFDEVEGLNVTTDVVEFREGSEPAIIHLLPGLSHYGPLILRYGATDDAQEMWDWMEEVLDGSIGSARRSMSVIIIDSEGNDVLRYNLSQAWPSGWSLGKLSSTGKSMAIEELVIQYEQLERVSYGG